MKPYFQDELCTILNGDCREGMAEMDAASVDAIVTDPPYGLSFMGKGWDHGVPGVEFWVEALRVLKPGGHLLAFGGSRTYHRLACAIEDAGFEVRDCIMWLYGSGFPKSLDVSKAMDKAAGAKREGGFVKAISGDAGIGMGMNAKCSACGKWKFSHDPCTCGKGDPATDAARQWEGWGTALKPAHEPIILARKPLAGTVAANVLEHGTGALNIDGCRVGDTGATTRTSQAEHPKNADGTEDRSKCWARTGHGIESLDKGRWPANVIHDGGDAATMLGDAARFFYCSKASKADRGPDNNHPTVKPTALMRYLCRLVTPPGGIVLDPFMGSGSTGKAALAEGFRFIGIEMQEEYAEIAANRLAQECLPFGDAP